MHPPTHAHDLRNAEDWVEVVVVQRASDSPASLTATSGCGSPLFCRAEILGRPWWHIKLRFYTRLTPLVCSPRVASDTRSPLTRTRQPCSRSSQTNACGVETCAVIFFRLSFLLLYHTEGARRTCLPSPGTGYLSCRGFRKACLLST